MPKTEHSESNGYSEPLTHQDSYLLQRVCSDIVIHPTIFNLSNPVTESTPLDEKDILLLEKLKVIFQPSTPTEKVEVEEPRLNTLFDARLTHEGRLTSFGVSGRLTETGKCVLHAEFGLVGGKDAQFVNHGSNLSLIDLEKKQEVKKGHIQFGATVYEEIDLDKKYGFRFNPPAALLSD